MTGVSVGIDDIRVYPSTLSLNMGTLVEARKGSVSDVVGDMLIDQRSVNPAWEDPVTLAVEAGRDLLQDNDPGKVRWLMVATESGPDQEKALSTWVQRYLDLPDSCRNIEVKHACYGGTASLRLAAAAVSVDPDPDASALVITTDQSRQHFGRPWEFVMGCGAAAMLVRKQPRFLRFEPSLTGFYTHEVSDLTRPTSRVEAGHSETSLLSYLEGAQVAFDRYAEAVRRENGPDLSDGGTFREWLPYLVYHAPFGGITRRAHAAIWRQVDGSGRRISYEDFGARVEPSLRFNRRMGGTYGSSVYISLLGAVDAFGSAVHGQRVGVYSYGSGSSAEYFSAIFGERATEVAERAGLLARLDARRQISVREYEEAERERTAWIDDGDFRNSLDGHEGWYAKAYDGRGKLVYEGQEDFVRQYRWS